MWKWGYWFEFCTQQKAHRSVVSMLWSNVPQLWIDFGVIFYRFDSYCSLVKECPWAVTDYYCPRIIHSLASVNLQWLPLQASLPLAKLCAMVTMQSMTGPNLQSFSLPLKLVSEGKKVWLTETSVQHSISIYILYYSILYISVKLSKLLCIVVNLIHHSTSIPYIITVNKITTVVNLYYTSLRSTSQ